MNSACFRTDIEPEPSRLPVGRHRDRFQEAKLNQFPFRNRGGVARGEGARPGADRSAPAGAPATTERGTDSGTHGGVAQGAASRISSPDTKITSDDGKPGSANLDLVQTEFQMG